MTVNHCELVAGWVGGCNVAMLPASKPHHGKLIKNCRPAKLDLAFAGTYPAYLDRHVSLDTCDCECTTSFTFDSFFASDPSNACIMVTVCVFAYVT